MLDGVSLDQLKAFIAAVDEGSFSGAGRKLLRAQSVISDMVATLEGQIGVQLFDRAGRYPKLTPQGDILLGDARKIVSTVDFMKARARGMSEGLEPELSAVVEVLFPIDVVANAAKAFSGQFPGTPLRLYVDALGGVLQLVLDGSASFGVIGPVAAIPPHMTTEPLTDVPFVLVASSDHPLALYKGVIPRSELTKHVQLVLTDRTNLSAGKDAGVLSPSTWRLTDLYAKHAFLLKGLGWGGMPLHAVQADLDAEKLVRLRVEGKPTEGMSVPHSAVYPTSTPPGPAGRWLIERLKVHASLEPAIAG